jgi:4-hydroxy-2-oxoheptanedioate aldolase
MGIQGLVGTHITCAQDAEAMVRASKLPPEGERGWGVFSRANRYALADETAAAEASNEEVLLVAMVEDRLGVEHIDEILAVPGIDAISVGTSDMAQSYGVPGKLTHPEIRTAVTRVCDAVERSSKAVSATAASRAMGLTQAEFARRYTSARYHLASAGGILRSGLSSYLASLSEFQSVSE